MYGRLFQAFYFLTFIALKCSDVTGHYDDKKIHYLSELLAETVTDFQNSVRFRPLKPLDYLLLQNTDEDFELKPSNLELRYQPQNVSKCVQDILYMVQNIRSEWGLKMIDSFGKPESGILNGNVRWIGDYNECVGIRVSNPDTNSTVGNFRGKYCSLTWSLKAFNLSYAFVSGVCIPDSCSASDLEHNALQLMQIAGILPAPNSTLNFGALKCKPTERHLNAAAKAIIALLSLFCALTILASSVTVVNYFKKVIKESKTTFYASETHMNHPLNDGNKHENAVPDFKLETLLHDDEIVTVRASLLKKLEPFLLCFCVFTNGAKLLNTSSSEGEFLCIHGIRFLSMSWVILGHTYGFFYQQIKNMVEVIPMLDNFPFQAVLQANHSVDSFFVLSGFLLAFLSMKEFSKTKGKISWPYFYIHRYMRLTPMYMVLLGFSATVYFYLGSGPYWPDGDYDLACKKNWWRNLLYINNFDVEAGQCMSWSWYLATDMQFFIISPLFLIALWRWPKLGYSLLAVFLLASCLCNFFITYHFDLSNGVIDFLHRGVKNFVEVEKKNAETFSKIYIKPYTRIGSYLLGIITGFIFFKWKASNAPKHSLLFLTIGWIIASSVSLPTIYGLYHANPGLIARCFHNALNRICFATGLCWVIYVCLIGQGGFINSLLSFKLFMPLSRLTFAAYLIHPMIINAYLGNLKSSMAFSHPIMVTLFLGFMLMTYALSVPISLILESPFVALEKLIRKKYRTEQKSEAMK